MISEQDFRFCPYCAHDFTRKADNLLVCTACNLHYYINPAITNAVILENEKGEILFVKRKHDPQKGLWDLPGGFVDREETMEASVVRELKEEIDVEVTEFHYIGSTYDTYEYEGLNLNVVCAIFLGHIPSDTHITPDDDASDYAFIAKKEIKYEMIAFDSLKEAIKKYVDASESSPLH